VIKGRERNREIMKRVSENAMLVPSLSDLQSFSDHLLGMGLQANRKIISEYLNKEKSAETSEVEIRDIRGEQDVVIKAINSTVQISKLVNNRLMDASEDNKIEDDLA